VQSYKYTRKLTKSLEDVIDLSIEVLENTYCSKKDLDNIVDLILEVVQGIRPRFKYVCEDNSIIVVYRKNKELGIEIYS